MIENDERDYEYELSVIYLILYFILKFNDVFYYNRNNRCFQWLIKLIQLISYFYKVDRYIHY